MKSRPLKPVRNEADRRKALKRLSLLMDAKPGTPDCDELAVLGVLIADYERRAFPIAPASPRDAIAFRMEQMGYDQAALAKLLGSRSRASEILSGKRKTLSLTLVKRLRDGWGISADLLVA